jgi:hypothetical protein
MEIMATARNVALIGLPTRAKRNGSADSHRIAMSTAATRSHHRDGGPSARNSRV